MSTDPNDDYPGTETAGPASRWDADDNCTFCTHAHSHHGPRRCGLLLVPETAIFCKCPIGRDAP